MAGEQTARAEAGRLATLMRSRGIQVSIELQQGRGEWHVPKYLVMNHHTATHKGSNPTPALGICKIGRSDVPGPLCNGYGGYDGVFRIITMGLANHPGQGGPITIDGVHVPGDSARGPTFGIEWEGGYHVWTADEREWMARVNVALADFYVRPLTSQLEHKTWAPDRKVDRKDLTRDVAISDARTYGTEDVMNADQEAKLDRVLASLTRIENNHLAEVKGDLDVLTSRRAPGRSYLAVDSRWDDPVGSPGRDEARAYGVWFVDEDHGSKVQLTTDGPLHQHLMNIDRVQGGNGQAVRVDRAALDDIDVDT